MAAENPEGMSLLGYCCGQCGSKFIVRDPPEKCAACGRLLDPRAASREVKNGYGTFHPGCWTPCEAILGHLHLNGKVRAEGMVNYLSSWKTHGSYADLIRALSQLTSLGYVKYTKRSNVRLTEKARSLSPGSYGGDYA